MAWYVGIKENNQNYELKQLHPSPQNGNLGIKTRAEFNRMDVRKLICSYRTL